ncbi:MAG TPA: hypothetical protein VKA25_07705 [Gemmatimonadales bacterium]|nr:hypothetical protein [Gemmatimonadales bacterium]
MGIKKSAADLFVRGAGGSVRLTVSCWHVADSWLTDKYGKQDSKEDDEKHDQHLTKPVMGFESPLKRDARGGP